MWDAPLIILKRPLQYSDHPDATLLWKRGVLFLRGSITPVVSFSHHNDVLGKRLAFDSADRENYFLSRFENMTIYKRRTE